MLMAEKATRILVRKQEGSEQQPYGCIFFLLFFGVKGEPTPPPSLYHLTEVFVGN